jgi:hypothetical protein
MEKCKLSNGTLWLLCILALEEITGRIMMAGLGAKRATVNAALGFIDTQMHFVQEEQFQSLIFQTTTW